jgi:ribonuclease T2
MIKLNYLIGVACTVLVGALSLTAKAGTPVTGYVMQIQMTPAMCHLNSSQSKKRKCLEGYSLNIVGLYPETMSSRCQTTSSATLAPLQAKVVARVMPDEPARVQLWRDVGGCVPMNASQYFRAIINYADRLKVPTDISSAETYPVTAAHIQQQFFKLNPRLTSKAIYFHCQSQRNMTYLTEVRVCYNVQGQYKNCPTSIQSNCPARYYIKGAY